MIVLHEVAHCRRWHVGWRVLPLLAMMLPALLVIGSESVFMDRDWSVGPSPFWQFSAIMAGMGVSCYLLSLIAKWTELDADRLAVWLAAQPDHGTKKPEQWSVMTQQTAARALIHALEKLTPAAHATRETWLHPSLARRRAALIERYFKSTLPLLESDTREIALSLPTLLWRYIPNDCPYPLSLVNAF